MSVLRDEEKGLWRRVYGNTSSGSIGINPFSRSYFVWFVSLLKVELQ